MKKVKLFMIFLAAFFILPFAVYADGEEENGEVTSEAVEESQPKEVKLYFFRGEGCPHCQEAEEWFKSIEEEYGQYFEVVDYETWNNTDNAELMQKVAAARNETAEGVPYILVGNKSWNGFTESYEPEIIEQIKSEYEKSDEDRYDIMKYLDSDQKEEKSSSSDVVALIIILAVVSGICFGVYKLKQSNE